MSKAKMTTKAGGTLSKRRTSRLSTRHTFPTITFPFVVRALDHAVSAA